MVVDQTNMIELGKMKKLILDHVREVVRLLAETPLDRLEEGQLLVVEEEEVVVMILGHHLEEEGLDILLGVE